LNKRDREQEQLGKFFQHNPIEDPQYLKRYVKQHPEHKMAWYLLGRQYAEKGQDGKAAYCFAQAGEIYEAFERQKLSVDLGALDAKKNKKLSRSVQRSKIKWLLFAALLLIIYSPVPGDSSNSSASNDKLAFKEPAGEMGVKSVGVQKNSEISYPSVTLLSGTKITYTSGKEGPNGWSAILQKMLLPTEDSPKTSVLVEGTKTPDGNWLQWYQLPKVLLSVNHSEDKMNQARIDYYDPQVCNCQPGDPSSMVSLVETWKHEKEESLILQSAIQAYQVRTGSLPQKVDQLTEPYPNNSLPGVSQYMKSSFTSAVKAVEAQNDQPSPSSFPSQSNESPVGGEKATAQVTSTHNAASHTAEKEPLIEPFKEPLQILVDKEKHRLLLVSGQFIVRSYPVGLGGAKTPEAEFTISEKVRNPNGKSNGDFGSRGMTLSDTLYAIHGTNKPGSIGKDQSLGCIRMQQEDVEELYDMVPIGTKVTIGKGIAPDQGPGDGGGGRASKPSKLFKMPLQTEESNPKKKYKWLD
jgi:lipoprotein-anchoring transpeptidase ErfK/SrfK